MNKYLEIATALEGKSLSFFIGTGFSKYLTDGKAPSWIELLVECTNKLDSMSRTNNIFNSLFINDLDDNITCKYDILICAQILELEYRKKSLDLKQSICDIINDRINVTTINKSKVEKMSEFFLQYPFINIITTNYDTLICDYIFNKNCRVFIEGNTTPTINTSNNVFHIHGSVLNPQSIVVTTNDYFNFQHKNSYFSRKLYTLLQETTTVVLGYSLGDFNLNSILNEARYSRSPGIKASDIYYISRDKIDKIYEEYYSCAFGINVIDETELQDFFTLLIAQIPKASDILNRRSDIRLVLSGKSIFVDDYLKLNHSFYDILIQASTEGINSNDEKFLDLMCNVLNRKKDFTRENGAWSQYSHLAEWLIELGSRINVKGTKIEDTYLELVEYSFSYMSKVLYFGYSWDAYNRWIYGWNNLILDNRELIKKLIETKFASSHDAYDLMQL